MRAGLLILVAATLLPAAATGGEVETLARDLLVASQSYDAAAVTVALAKLRATEDQDEAGALALRVRAGLLLAELYRVQFEQIPIDQRQRRRPVGQQIDVAAEEALALVDRLPETSERERIRADLLATLMRSDYRARKHEQDLRQAIARALELDPDNPNALVTAAKPALFADPDQGGDAREAIRLLDRALEIDPELESGILLRAHAYDVLGESERALAEWRRALEINPECQPAHWRIESEDGIQ